MLPKFQSPDFAFNCWITKGTTSFCDFSLKGQLLNRIFMLGSFLVFSFNQLNQISLFILSFLIFSNMQISRKELRRREKLKENEELKEDIEFIFDDLWESLSQDPFREAFTRKTQRNILEGFIHALMRDSKEVSMKDFCATDYQVRKIRVLMLFCTFLKLVSITQLYP